MAGCTLLSSLGPNWASLGGVEPNNHFKLLAGLYDDNPIGPCPEDLDPGQCNENGLDFRLNDPPLLLVEGDYSYDHGVAGLPGTIKLGGWRDFGKVDDQRLDVNGGLQAVTGADALRHDGNFAFYGVMDHSTVSPETMTAGASPSLHGW